MAAERLVAVHGSDLFPLANQLDEDQFVRAVATTYRVSQRTAEAIWARFGRSDPDRDQSLRWTRTQSGSSL
jgi:hypothetical protein